MEKQLKKLLGVDGFKDVTETRSRVMSAIRAKHNRSTEMVFRMQLVREGITGWRTHAVLPGKPDFYFRSKEIAVFIDGCFWHGCPHCGHVPKTRNTFWNCKLKRTKQRDNTVTRILKSHGIRVIRIWEHEVGTRKSLMRVLRKLEGQE